MTEPNLSAESTYEENLDRLKSVVERLERGSLSLGESLKLFEEGLRLSETCDSQLEEVEARVRVLLEEPRALNPRKDIELEAIEVPKSGGIDKIEEDAEGMTAC